MADVNDIVCLGFGSWSSVNQLPTLGFASGSVSAITVSSTGISIHVGDEKTEVQQEMVAITEMTDRDKTYVSEGATIHVGKRETEADFKKVQIAL